MLIGSSSTTSSSATSNSSSQASTDQKQIDSQLNQFLKLLVTQLQHQDPLQPMDANQFTQQLVQFASVEQQVYQNANLEKLVSMQQGGQMGSVINYLGSMVEFAGDTMSLQGGSAAASYTLPNSAAQTTIRVKDTAGNTVFSAAGETSSGTHAFGWDGLSNAGKALADGTYKIEVEAKRSDGTSLDVSTHVLGLVSGIVNDGSNPQLVIGDAQVPLSEVLSVNLPAAITSTTVDG